MARTGMTELINVLRGYTDTSDNDYQIGTATYWEDTQLQTVLDRHRTDVIYEQLTVDPKYVGGSIQYFTYRSNHANYEQTTGGTAIFWLEHGTGDDVGTANYSVDYLNGIVTFIADTGGSVLYLTGRSYDINAAAADVWHQKMAHYAGKFSFSTDTQKFNRNELITNARLMAEYYGSQGKPFTVTMYRSDVDAGALK